MADSKMAKVTYEGPAKTLQLADGGTEYHPGDTFSLPQAQLTDLLRRRHHFKDIAFDEELPAPHEVPDAPDPDAPTTGRKRTPATPA